MAQWHRGETGAREDVIASSFRLHGRTSPEILDFSLGRERGRNAEYTPPRDRIRLTKRMLVSGVA
jgi:hypothetical protein